jgi:prepilin-type N-terminal cleavage/methylation domain-containing protein
VIPQRARRVARAGFSLVEVLVTLLIVGGIMVALTQLLEAARLSRDTIMHIQETQLAGPAIMDLIERDLRALTVYDRTKEDLLRVQDRVVHGLDSDSIDFVATTDSLVPAQVNRRYVRSDVNEVGYRLRPNPKLDDFLEIYRREGFGVDEEPFDEGAYTFLHDKVKQFDIQVYTEDGPDAEPQDDWGFEDDETGLPLRLEITLVLELSPRIHREPLRYFTMDRRTITYRRVIRLPQMLIDSLEIEPVPLIPVILDPDDVEPEPEPTPPPTGP